jgi:hypothetical protein
MPRRRLQRWLERRVQAHALLVARHVLIQRRPAIERLARSLGYGPDDTGAADDDATGRPQFVPPLRDALGELVAPFDVGLHAPAAEDELAMTPWQLAQPDEVAIEPGGRAASRAPHPGAGPGETATDVVVSDRPPNRATAVPVASTDPERAAPAAPLTTADARSPSLTPVAGPTAADAGNARAASDDAASALAALARGAPRSVIRETVDDGQEAQPRADRAEPIPPATVRLTPPADLPVSIAEEWPADDERPSPPMDAVPAAREALETGGSPPESARQLEQAGAVSAPFAGEPAIPVAQAARETTQRTLGVPVAAAATGAAADREGSVEREIAPVDRAESPAIDLSRPADDTPPAMRADEAPSAPGARPAAIEERQARRPARLRIGADAAPPEGPSESAAAGERRDPLFRSKHPDRTAQDWMRLLGEATQAATTPIPVPLPATLPVLGATRGPAPARRPAALRAADRTTVRPTPATERPSPALALDPTPLLGATRRFLRPLVGIDTDTVRVYRGVAAQELASRRHADALTIDDDVVLPPAHAERDAETLGIVAHELVHVARRRDPTFVPPILRPTPTVLAADPDGHARESGRSARRPPAIASEESIALAVESRVRAAATAASTGGAVQTGMTPSLGGPDDQSSRGRDGPWGTLPAPWEPIPGFEESPVAMATPMATPARGAGSAMRSSAGAHESVDGSPPADLRHADVDRSVEPAAEPTPAAHVTHGAEPPRTDVDVLARQVYAILKRRLAAEQRRGA